MELRSVKGGGVGWSSCGEEPVEGEGGVGWSSYGEEPVESEGGVGWSSCGEEPVEGEGRVGRSACGEESEEKDKWGELVGALSPVNHKGLHQRRKQTSIYLQVMNSTRHHKTSVFFSNHNSNSIHAFGKQT